MPDDYSSIGGGLKLKGAGTGAGIKKKKKKKSTLSATASGLKPALQQALKEEDMLELKDAKEGDEEGGMSGLSEEQLRELDQRDGSGKTASERAHEETRRRRVCHIFYPYHEKPFSATSIMDLFTSDINMSIPICIHLNMDFIPI